MTTSDEQASFPIALDNDCMGVAGSRQVSRGMLAIYRTVNGEKLDQSLGRMSNILIPMAANHIGRVTQFATGVSPCLLRLNQIVSRATPLTIVVLSPSLGGQQNST